MPHNVERKVDALALQCGAGAQKNVIALTTTDRAYSQNIQPGGNIIAR